jgi:zinc/manganese transport system permease protein
MNLVGGFHALGTLMAVGIMILPAAAARFWVYGIGSMLTVAATIAVFSSYSGLLLSYHYSFPSGPTIILAAGAAYLFSIVFGRQGGLVHQTHVARSEQLKAMKPL